MFSFWLSSSFHLLRLKANFVRKVSEYAKYLSLYSEKLCWTVVSYAIKKLHNFWAVCRNLMNFGHEVYLEVPNISYVEAGSQFCTRNSRILQKRRRSTLNQGFSPLFCKIQKFIASSFFTVSGRFLRNCFTKFISTSSLFDPEFKRYSEDRVSSRS